LATGVARAKRAPDDGEGDGFAEGLEDGLGPAAAQERIANRKNVKSIIFCMAKANIIAQA